VAIVARDRKPSDVEIASSDDIRRSVDHALTSLGLTLDELMRQAAQGQFSSNRARLVWMAIHTVVQPPG
jgi:NAD(P)H-hydrate repair Nnr-like enzyme with NAD(P)H-hydrate epimerase domain